MTEDDFRRYEKRVAEAGFSQIGGYDVDHAGSWIIQVSRPDLPRQRIVWNAREQTLTVETAAKVGWFLKWYGAEHETAAALASLKAPVSEDWLAEKEEERAEGWATFYLQQAQTIAVDLWERGRYAEYAETLAPYRERLSPAQLKRLDIAKRRIADG